MPLTPPLSLYDILEVEQSASIDDVRRAFKRKALETHPDKLHQGASEEEKLAAEARFHKVYEAFQILSNSQKRQAYDIRLHLKVNNREKSTSSERADQRMKDRREWFQQRLEQRRIRMEAIRALRRTEEMLEQAKEVDRMVNEMMNALYAELPGWADRRSKAQQMKLERELREKQSSRSI